MTLTTPIPRLAHDILYLHKICGDSHFSSSRDMIAGVKIKNGSFDQDHAPLRVGLSSVG